MSLASDHEKEVRANLVDSAAKPAAYNANEVAAVYMAFDEASLKTRAEGGGGNLNDESLRNGFYGMSDPLKLRAVLTRFEFDLNYGGNTNFFKIRIINPTAELESTLFRYYDEVYPAADGPMETFAKDVTRQKSMEGTEVTDPEENWKKEPPKLPQLFLRFGYGTDEEHGLSTIHKAILTNVNYKISANADKVVELMLADVFTYTSTSTSFNRRDHIVKTPVIGGVSKLIQKPSELLETTLMNYTSVYPECIPFVDLDSFGPKLDNVVFSLAATLAKKDSLSQKEREENITRESKGLPPKESPDNPVDILNELPREDKDRINSLLTTPVTPNVNLDFKTGEINTELLLQAYQLVFAELGFDWKWGDAIEEKPTPGVISSSQIENTNDVVGQPQESTLIYKKDGKEAEIGKMTIDIETEYMWEKDGGDGTGMPGMLANQPTSLDQNDLPALTFWPKALDAVPEADAISDQPPIANILSIQRAGSLKIPYEWNTGAQIGCPDPTSPNPPPAAKYGVNPQPPTEAFKGFAPSSQGYLGLPPGPPGCSDGDGTEPYYASANQTGATPPADYVVVEFDDVIPRENFAYWAQGWVDGVQDLVPDLAGNIGLRGGVKNSADQVWFENVEGSTELNNTSYYLYIPSIDAPWADGFDNDGKHAMLCRDFACTDFVRGDEISEFIFGLGKAQIVSAANYLNTGKAPYARSVRNLTNEEKRAAMRAGWAPLWLGGTGGGWRNTEPPGSATQPKIFTLNQIDKRLDNKKKVEANTAWQQNVDYTLPDQYVGISRPIEQDGQPWQFTPVGIGGYRNMGVKGNSKIGFPNANSMTDLRMPIYDLENNELLRWSDGSGMLEEDNQYLSWGDTLAWLRPFGQPIELEPTHDTYTYLCRMNSELQREAGTKAMTEKEKMKALLAKAREDAKKEDGAPKENPAPPPQPKVPPPQPRNAFLILGTEGKNPDIKRKLMRIINGVNKFIIGESQKIIVMPLDLATLTPVQTEELRVLMNIKENEWNDLIAGTPSFILVQPDTKISTFMSKTTLNPIRSFPEIQSKTGGPAQIFLSYGTNDSIIAKLDFDAGTRMLTNIMQTVYSVRQWADIRTVVNDPDVNMLQVITTVISNGLAKQIETLKERALEDNMTDELVKEISAELASVQDMYVRVQKIDADDKGADMLVDSDLLSLFPKMVKSYSTNDEVQDINPSLTKKELQIMASVMQNTKMVNMLFPNTEIEGTSNRKTTPTLQVGPDGISVKQHKAGILKRKIDFAYARNRIGKIEREGKASDFGWSYARAMQDEAWSIDITTLGVPEMDTLYTEMLSRIINLKVFDPRLGSKKYHWLTGTYQVKGIKHVIDTQAGYLMSLKLIKNPAYSASQLIKWD